MALTYHEVMTTDFATLGTAATAWDAMAGKFETLETTYEKKVQSTTTSGAWLGQAQQVAAPNFAVTRNEYNSAQIQARAVAALLREAQTLFTELRGKVKAAVAEAVAAGMKVSEGGIASFDFSKADRATASAARHDPDLPEVERSWTRRIQQTVDAFDEADRGVKLALVDAVTDSDFRDGTFGGFNGSRPYPSLAAAAKAENMPKDPAAVGAWWRSLDPVTRGILLEERGDALKKAGILTPDYRWTSPDPGAGPFDVEDPTAHDAYLLALAESMMAGGDLIGRTDASRNLAHFLEGTGKPLTLDVDRALSDDGALRAAVAEDISKHRNRWKQEALEAFRKSGGALVSIPVETRGSGTFEDRNWYLGVGSHQRVVSGNVSVVPDAQGRPKITMDYQVDLYDRYNWDAGKATPIGPTTITDADMARLHTVGLAQEYDMHGTSSIRQHDLGAADQPSVSPGDPGRDGTRQDPSRGTEENR
ncbi:hypothetical protein [Streptomyces bambusae]|uniref:WXG100 family type VII secretion target n=1 Tax=Streptomyces bambusae TaxID=1550616 RepID=A0ABS6ZDG2_9ACTN|nr:hypothetical protein [Streptomyces bambusae]MBW5485805.1 hypothetical protein [Streptomyces bambusae]